MESSHQGRPDNRRQREALGVSGATRSECSRGVGCHQPHQRTLARTSLRSPLPESSPHNGESRRAQWRSRDPPETKRSRRPDHEAARDRPVYSRKRMGAGNPRVRAPRYRTGRTTRVTAPHLTASRDHWAAKQPPKGNLRKGLDIRLPCRQSEAASAPGGAGSLHALLPTSATAFFSTRHGALSWDPFSKRPVGPPTYSPSGTADGNRACRKKTRR